MADSIGAGMENGRVELFAIEGVVGLGRDGTSLAYVMHKNAILTCFPYNPSLNKHRPQLLNCKLISQGIWNRLKNVVSLQCRIKEASVSFFHVRTMKPSRRQVIVKEWRANPKEWRAKAGLSERKNQRNDEPKPKE